MTPRNMVYAVSAIAFGALAALTRPFIPNRRFTGFHTWTGRSKASTAQWTPELLKQLEWRRFEELCAAYYEARGVIPKDVVLHAKAWDAYRVGVKSVRELRAAMSAAKVGDGVLLTSGRFTQEAVNLARQEGIETIDGAALLDRIAALPPEQGAALLKFATQGDFLTPTCPSCSIKMISRKSTNEGRKFWGCRNYPACKQTFASTANAPA